MVRPNYTRLLPSAVFVSLGYISRAVDRVFDDLEQELHKPYLMRSYLRPRGIYKVLVPTAVGEPDHVIL